MNCVNAGVRTELVKEALRYFLSHVRDEKVESMYIDSTELSQFRSNLKPNLFTMDDMLRLMDTRPTPTPTMMMPQPIVVPQQTIVQEDTTNNINNDIDEIKEEVEPNITFDCDNTEILVNEDMLGMDF